jgi:hypothetical protein
MTTNDDTWRDIADQLTPVPTGAGVDGSSELCIRQVGAFGEILAQQAIGVFVGSRTASSALP